jgi:protoporphyrinogen oxidase
MGVQVQRQSAPIQILGAGLAGLSAARSLGARCEIHEKLAHAGGHVITLEEDGFRFDRTGHLLHLRDPEMRDWLSKLLDGQLVTVDRMSRVFSHGVYTRYPYQANTFGLPKEIAYECLMGLLEAERVKDSTPEPHNFEEFCLKHFGAGFSKHFMIPYNEKLWGVHPREITAAWCSRFVPMPKLSDVIAGAVGLNDRELGYNTHFLYPRLGIGELPKAMVRELDRPIAYQHAPRTIDAAKRTLVFADGEISYDVLISTLPLDTLIGTIGDVPSEVREAASRLRCNPLWYLDVALDVPCGVSGLHWAYVPENKYPFYRVGCYSNFSQAMAPAGKSCFYVELSSRREPNMDELLPVVASGLVDMGIMSKASDIRFARARKIEHAYVVFDHHYYEALSVIRPYLEANRILSVGRYGGWNYSAMEDALIFGRDAAQRALELMA